MLPDHLLVSRDPHSKGLDERGHGSFPSTHSPSLVVARSIGTLSSHGYYVRGGSARRFRTTASLGCFPYAAFERQSYQEA